MRQALLLLGIMTAIVAIGAFIAFERVQAPTQTDVYENKVITPMSLTLTAATFAHEGVIPAKYTCDGDGINPELRISGVPEGTQSFVLVMDDPDIPENVKQARGIEKFDHWVLYNIPADVTVISEGQQVGTSGLSSVGRHGYIGPCPPDREHRYIFRLYALPGTLTFNSSPTLGEVETAAKVQALESVTLIGKYERPHK